MTETPAAYRTKHQPRTDKADAFLFLWRALAPAGAPQPAREFLFVPGRKFRADFAFVLARVIVEIDGGQWQAHGGRHAHDEDREKFNLAAELGWRVLRYSPEMLERRPGDVVTQVCRCLTKLTE